MSRDTATLRTDARALIEAALRATDAGDAVRRHLRPTAEHLQIGTLRRPWAEIDRLVVLGAGKASVRMAEAVERALGDRVSDGLIVAPHGLRGDLERIRVWGGGHPLPDAAGQAGTEALLSLASGLGPRDHAIVLISGGGSALLVAPAEGLTLDDLRATTTALLRSGAEVAHLNVLRRHLSAVAGGWLAAVLHPAPSWTLVLSDVVGEDLGAVASGPTLPDPTTFGHAWQVVTEYGLEPELPPAVIARLQRGLRGEVDDTPKPGNPWFQHAVTGLVGSVRDALEGAEREARARGYLARAVTDCQQGEAREVGAELARQALVLRRTATSPICLLYGGETTVTVTGDGVGGRNQEVALSAARLLAGTAGIVVFSVGTDGVDGPTEAAGGLVDGGTWHRARAAGFDALTALARNDAFRALDASGDLIVTGPTGTNVADVMGLLVSPA